MLTSGFIGRKKENEGLKNPSEEAKRKSRRSKCQIDFLIQTKDGNLYICEIKFRKDALDSCVIAEVKEKVNRLKRKKYMSCRPVLIHVNGVSEPIKQSDYFVQIIDFSELLHKE